jgi:Subtilase family/Bacterial TSP3 repeat
VKPRFFPSSAFSLIAIGLLLQASFPAGAQVKPIRLRNGVIPPQASQPVVSQANSALAQPPVSGLFLIQFTRPPGRDVREQLAASGVDLLHYVPEDTFVARLRGVSLDRLRTAPLVAWVGEYRSEHKVHPRLAAAARAALQTNQLVAVNVLIAPQATPAEITEARSLFSALTHESQFRQGTIMRGALAPDRLDALAQAIAVLWIERAPRRKLVDEAAAKVVGGDDGLTATPTVTQQLGFDGTGVTVCVADTGLDSGNTNTMHPDLRGRVTGFKYYGSNIADGSDGYGHGTHCAGIVAGNAATGETDPDTGAFYGLGIASHANLFIERIFDDAAGEANPFPRDDTLTQDAVQNGAVIGSNSWGNDVQGEYDTDAWQFDQLVRDADLSTPGDQPYILEFSSGNAGPDTQTVGSPATGKNVIATGASENVPGTLALTYGLYADGADTMADFSSRGPCEDGRIKPDLVAPGTWIASAASAAAPDEASIAWTAIDSYYVYMGGTSMSGPHAAGAAAVFVQYYKSTHTNTMPSPALVKAALINSANELDELNGGPGPIPNNDEGWGRITLTNIIVTNLSTAPRYYEYVDQTTLLTNGQVYVHHSLVQNSGQPLKITLAYTDVAGFPGAIPALVNDLDLEVVGPDGTLYRGNQFAGNDSVPNAPSPDNLNNVEAVHLSQPQPGDYLIRVRARHVVEDARLDTAVIDQDFALVVSGDLARPGAGSVLLDRPTYTAPGLIQLSVFDSARTASSTVSVLVTSTTETNGETITLHPSGNYGVFTGAVATVVGPAALDGKLEIHAGDSIEADYVDSFGVKRVATALADLAPPLISGVAAAVDVGVITITWQTTEPSSSIVRYSTNLTFNLATTNSALVTSHTVRLTKLVPGKTYYFYVVSDDEAGNAVTDDNSGAYFSFVAVPTPTVLMVDDYDTVGEEDAGAPVIDDGVYTNALATAGFSYGFWKVNQRGYPQLTDLQPFPVVVWRTTDDIIYYAGTNNTLTAQQQFMIQNYLNGGGSFFMASMGILSQLGNVAFRKNVFQVAGFKQNPDPPSPCTDCDEYFGVPAILGAPGNTISGGMSATLDYSQYPNFDLFDIVYGPDFSDTFTPATNATAIVFESVSGKACGVSFPRVGVDSPGRVVFLSFPIDAVPATGSPTNTEVVLLRNILNFLTPGANGIGEISLNNSVYSMPDQVIVEVGDSDLIGAGQTQATFSTSSGVNRVTITLNETTHPGLFRGFLTLVATNAAANQLTAHNGDTITATYFDASNNSNVVATATIDTVPPVISQVAAVTSFGDATVTWITSKPADSLVQYGEAVLLDRTAYNGALVTNHSVTVSGLLANRDYYYQVVSGDAADNTTVDDNHGNLYTFTTEKAPQPPWFDNLEHGQGDWAVVPDAGTVLNWSFGTPNNGLQTSAHSGTNAWGSNLYGQSLALFDMESSFLYSPVIDLSGFSSATLTFWHSFDFSSSYVFAQLGISTSSSLPPASVPTLIDYAGQSSLNWEQATVDLTAFVGKTIQVVWYYGAIGDGSGPQDGWLVDDVSITGVAGGGTIVITKNLGQGTFTLNGLLSQSGTAPSTTITNAPPGPYTVQFSDVAFYQTPPDQAGTLTNGGLLALSGVYDFIDANHNGISDAWEKYYFGSVTTNRTQYTDTDGDGMSDYAEFIAGTNPTNPASKLIFLSATLQPNKHFQLEWAAIPGRLYQVESSAVLPGQTPSARLSGSFDKPSGSFKLHIDAQANSPYAIQASTNLTAWTSVYTNLPGGKLDFLDSPAAHSTRRFYRTLALTTSSATTNVASWAPISDWLKASASPMSFTTTNIPQDSHFYRVQVRP